MLRQTCCATLLDQTTTLKAVTEVSHGITEIAAIGSHHKLPDRRHDRNIVALAATETTDWATASSLYTFNVPTGRSGRGLRCCLFSSLTICCACRSIKRGR